MGFELNDRVMGLNVQLQAFMDKHIYPREHEGGRAPELSERPSKRTIHFGDHFAPKGGLKHSALFWNPF